MKTHLQLALLLLFGLAPTAPLHPQELEPKQEPALETPDAPAPPEAVRKTRHRRHSRQDIVVSGSDVIIKADEKAGNVVIFGGSVTVEEKGQVGGHLVVIGGSAKIGPEAEVKGDAVVLGGVLEVNPSARIAGDRVNFAVPAGKAHPAWLQWPRQWFNKGFLWARPLPHQYLWGWSIAGVFLLLYVVGAALFPRQIQDSLQTMEAKPGSSLLVGLLGTILCALVALLCVMTIVGVVLLPFLAVAMITACFFGKVTVYRYAGEQMRRQTGLNTSQKPLLALVVGTLLFYLLYTIPVLGFAVWGGAVLLGFGAVLLAGTQRFRKASFTGAPPAGVVVAPSVTEGGGSAPPLRAHSDTIVLPRSGFWLRLGATLLDLLLFGMLSALLHPPGRAFLLLWTIYHISMWAWKGATLGGMVLRLRIVRVDGTPITLAAALVRSLSSFLSAAALFLGFFWAGWSREKRAWHDRIAGTLVVRMPPGTPLP